MSLEYACFAVLGAVILFQGFLLLRTMTKQEKVIQALMEHAQNERKDLLDRIQAPTFLEYTNKKIREKIAEKPKEPEEDRPDFIS